MIKYFSLVFLLVTVSIIDSKGQSAPPPPANLLPTITTPSPEVAAFTKFGNYEVNLFNGTPDISIPLYDISVGDLKVPISISYNASGIRVNDVPSNIGTGWNLNAGGAITRKVMGGLPDEYSVSSSNAGSLGYLNGGTAQNTSNFDPGSTNGLLYLRNIADHHQVDAEPDIFSYSMAGKSGHFIFSQQDNLKPFFVPYEPYTVTPAITGLYSMNLAMTDESGINYQFNSQETSLNTGQLFDAPIISSWMLTKMLSPNMQDSIIFHYSSAAQLTQAFPNDNLTVIDDVDIISGTSGYSPNSNIPAIVSATYSTTNQLNLDSINFRNGKIVFQLAPESRLDLGLTGLKNRMQKILIYNLIGNTYSLIKEIDFYHSYFIRYAGYATNPSYDSTSSRRLRLDSVIVKDGSGENVQRYAFGYNSRTDNYGLPDQNAKCIDYWGYYNGQFATTLLPHMSIPYTPYSGSTTQQIIIGAATANSRNPNATFMQADILNQITYPTGGYTTFTYETNQYSPDNLITDASLAGGLRIRQIQSFDGVTPAPITKTYIYGPNQSGVGVQNFVLNNYFFQTTQTRRYAYIPSGTASYTVGATETIRTFMANPSIGLEPWDATPVAYPEVTEYDGDSISNSGKTVYDFNDISDNLAFQDLGPFDIIYSNAYHRGQVLYKTVYRHNTDNSYGIVHQTQNSYAAFPDSIRNYDALSVTHNLYTDGTTSTGAPLDANLWAAEDADGNPINGTEEYLIFNYGVQSGDNRLIQTTDVTYDQNTPANTASTTKNYYYDNFRHMQPTRIVTTNSKGQVIIDTLQYPNEWAQTGNVYQSMVNSNVLNKVIQDKQTNNGAPINLKITNYANWGNNNFLPQTIQLQIGNNPIETRANFIAYDQRGNIQQMQKTDDEMLSYIWDYKSMYPIATVTNAAESDIAYTSFEADGTGNWSFSGSPAADTTSPTGNNCYNLSGGAVSKTGMTAGTRYVLSYWIKGTTTPLTIAGTQSGYPVQGKTISGWTYFEHLITGQTSITVAGSNYIDELRLYPANAQMTTYTYAPLFGVTTSCDVDNKATYYFYDAIGRLKWIKDQDKNIIKTVQYHYRGIPGIEY